MIWPNEDIQSNHNNVHRVIFHSIIDGYLSFACESSLEWEIVESH